jgi:hypothetical protein
MAGSSSRHSWRCHSSRESPDPVRRQIEVSNYFTEFVAGSLTSTETMRATGRTATNNVFAFRTTEAQLLRELYLLMMAEMAGMTFGRGWRGYY